jgi:hypothetical protein
MESLYVVCNKYNNACHIYTSIKSAIDTTNDDTIFLKANLDWDDFYPGQPVQVLLIKWKNQPISANIFKTSDRLYEMYDKIFPHNHLIGEIIPNVVIH